MSFQTSKTLVLNYYRELDSALGLFYNNEISLVLKKYLSEDHLFRGMHPFYEIDDREELATQFWVPLKKSFQPIQRRMDIFMAGKNELEENPSEAVWVCSMGHLMGNFMEPWLGIPAHRKMAFLRYAEFFKVEDGKEGKKIVESALFFDIISVMKQAGLQPLPTATGLEIITPGPMTHDGLLYDEQSPVDSKKTLDLINRMINSINEGQYTTPKEELSENWHDGMIWYGPAGIGASYTHEGYILQHQAPFRQGINDRKFLGHVCRFAEGNYGGFFGWSNLSLQLGGNFLGMPASEKASEMRVVDIYRRDGDLLAENWVFIDLLHFLFKLGLDLLGRMNYLHYRELVYTSEGQTKRKMGK